MKNMQQRNDGSSKRRTDLANKIGAIFSGACGIARSPNMPFGFGISAAAVDEDDDDEEKDFEKVGNGRPVSALNKTHPCEHIQVHAVAKCIKRLSSQRRPVAVASAILTRKWKTGLKRVKLKLKRDLKTTTAKTGNDEAKSELELCKKRILMGEKCRALNLSGVLHYDKQGILLPED